METEYFAYQYFQDRSCVCFNTSPEFHQFSRSVVADSASPWTAARQASLSITNSRSLLKRVVYKILKVSWSLNSSWSVPRQPCVPTEQSPVLGRKRRLQNSLPFSSLSSPPPGASGCSGKQLSPRGRRLYLACYCRAAADMRNVRSREAEGGSRDGALA